MEQGNLTKGPILKTLTKLAIPIMASSFLGTLYNLTDMAWIGLLGSKAVAGVGVVAACVAASAPNSCSFVAFGTRFPARLTAPLCARGVRMLRLCARRSRWLHGGGGVTGA